MGANKKTHVEQLAHEGAEDGVDPLIEQLIARMLDGEPAHQVLPSSGSSGMKMLDRMAEMLRALEEVSGWQPLRVERQKENG